MCFFVVGAMDGVFLGGVFVVVVVFFFGGGDGTLKGKPKKKMGCNQKIEAVRMNLLFFAGHE